MGKLIWNESGDLWKRIDSQVSFITGANLKKKDPDKKPIKKKPRKSKKNP